MKLKILDTNIVSAIMQGNEVVVHRFMDVPEPAISFITEMELRAGLAKKSNTRRNEMFRRFMMQVQVLYWDRRDTLTYASERQKMEAMGKKMGDFDQMIAVQAIVRGATLVTADKHFNLVPGLIVENWIESATTKR